MPKTIAFTMLTPVVLVAVICAAISFRLMPSGIWRIGPVWNGGAKARFGSVTVGYQSGTWLFERDIISDDGLNALLSMSVLSSSTTAVHTFGRLMSNCAIRAAGNYFACARR